ncbi:pyruvate, water dikinase regulatory protein [Anaerococcus porci]|uniref:Kinase/pyrophosphorylase n=1 Tax=Anaerococcus porci TaxID=2652269 RepID=A0A6N7VW10_9FIRM|nr:pyruvate, phosphate dikinase/phosphoenolpyruvate synthase regulator [Anaerococcus porci]MDY3006434.1 pyruvate, phosphate dikinase/phosphoenolpyruvate synthase regulator [Anaerococcus porci]MSS78253.1 kinase/pyrophosphorylase [Anaerococcus porci]
MKLSINILSDTSGYATEQIVKVSLSQFDVDTIINIYPDIRDIDSLKDNLEFIRKTNENFFIYHSFQDSQMNVYINNFCELNNISYVDITGYSIRNLSKKLKLKPKNRYSSQSLYESIHFKTMNAFDFAIKYDDGKDFRSLKACDIAIIGVSRSSKTPLSIYLASKGLKVCNIPILLKASLPRELFEIDSNKIFGLTIDENRLKSLREERLKSLNIFSESKYSDINEIRKELKYAKDIMDDLSCKIIDVTNKSIEETSDIIVNTLNEYERGKK